MERKLKQLNKIREILRQLSTDDLFHRDLKTEIVQKAIKHWTRAKVLSTDEENELLRNRSVIAVLPKLQKLQQVCKEAGIGPVVPQQLMNSRRSDFDEDFLRLFFGEYYSNYAQASGENCPKNIELEPVPKKISNLEYYLTWGKRGSQDFSLKKAFIRSLVDTLFFVALFYVAVYLWGIYFRKFHGTSSESMSSYSRVDPLPFKGIPRSSYLLDEIDSDEF